MKYIKRYWVTISFVLSFILDAQYGILEKLISDPFWLNIVKGLGALLLAYFTGNKLVSSTESPIVGNRPNDR